MELMPLMPLMRQSSMNTQAFDMYINNTKVFNYIFLLMNSNKSIKISIINIETNVYKRKYDRITIR